MRSAFGVEHGISKADDHDRKMRNLTAGIGGASTVLGGATGAIGVAEHRGKDPMGFTGTNTWKQKPRSAGAKAKILRASAKAHYKQAGVAGAVGAAGLGAAGLYQHRMKQKQISKMSERARSNLTEAAGGTTSAAAVASGAATANMLGSHAHHHYMIQRQDTKDLATKKRMPKAQVNWIKDSRKVSRRVAGIKGAGALAGAGLAGAGGYGLYQTGKKAMKKNFGKGLNPKNMEALDRTGRRLAGSPAGDYANAKLALRLSGRSRARDAGGHAWNKKTMAMTLKPLEKRPLP
jgi:hypothetical protein